MIKPASDEEIHLLDYIIVLVKHARLIIFASAAATVLTYLFLFVLPNKYTATARLLPPQQKTTLSAQILEGLGMSSSPAVASGGAWAAMLGLKSPGDIYVGILTGNTILDRVIKRFDLRKLYGSKYIEDVRRSLSGKSEITTEKNGLILIEVSDEDPKLAAQMANAFVEELDKLLQELAHQEARSHLAFLEKERSQSGLNLAKAEESLRSFSENTNVIQIDAQTKSVLEYTASLRAAIDAKEVQIQVMRQQATPHNFEIIRLETELKGLKEKLRESETQVGQNFIGDVCLPSTKVPALGMEYFRLVREAKYQEGIYQLYCKLVELARLEMARDVPVANPVDRATIPEKRSNRRLVPAILVGTGVFFVMIMVAFLRDYLQRLKENQKEAARLSVLAGYWEMQQQALRRLRGLVKFRGRSEKSS